MYNYAILLVDILSYIVYMGRVKIFIYIKIFEIYWLKNKIKVILFVPPMGQKGSPHEAKGIHVIFGRTP